jgi:hypothetical protein
MPPPPPAKPELDRLSQRAAGSRDTAPIELTAVDDTSSSEVLVLSSIDISPVRAMLARHGLSLESVADGAPIPGSYWGESEAGVIGNVVYARRDTPVHSLLHETCHLIVAPAEKREHIDTDASDSQAEEDATCYLQIVLADELPGVGALRMCADMDRWGYTFRLGSAREWYERDAEDARAWLMQRGLLADL